MRNVCLVFGTCVDVSEWDECVSRSIGKKGSWGKIKCQTPFSLCSQEDEEGSDNEIIKG